MSVRTDPVWQPSDIPDVRALGTVLGIWAHPDDEAFLSGGLMAAARDHGQRVVCVTATLGEHGTADPRAWPPDRLARTRRFELRASLAVLGVDEHHLLGMVDGTLPDQPFDAAVQRLTSLMQQVRPDTVITFGPDGLTGHADHQTVSAWATAARARAVPDARLLYVTTTAEFADRWQHLHDELDVFLATGLPLRTPASALDLELCLPPALADRKLAALRAQATQTARMVTTVGEHQMRAWWSVESFVDADHAQTTGGWGTWRAAA